MLLRELTGLAAVFTLVCLACETSCEPLRIGADASVSDNPRSHYSRYVNWRPFDGEVVDLNPPRMSWPLWPDWPKDWSDTSHSFTLQISARPDCSDPVVSVTSPYNFHNALPVLTGASKWYWRIGYDLGTPKQRFSAIRSFTISPQASQWDRSGLADPKFPIPAHPRVLFTAASLPRIRALAQENPSSKAALDYMVQRADNILSKPWWKAFPTSDRGTEPQQPFYSIAEDLVTVCFVWRMTDDPRYAGVKERALQWAAYPPGGRSSPEGLGGDGSEDATQGNEHLALLFDWLYPDLTEPERQVMINSLRWRVDHIMNRFSWATGGGRGGMLRLTFRSAADRSLQLGDARQTVTPSDQWREQTWEVAVPADATHVAIEPFNYYSAGEVWWDRVQVTDEKGAALVRNPDFSLATANAPTGWSSSDYGTAATLKFDPKGGADGTGAVGILCRDSTQRGAWSQSVALQGARQLTVTVRYRTAIGAGQPTVRASSLAGLAASHQFEAAMDTAVCGLVLYEHSPVGKAWYDLISNFLAGVTCSHGFDEAWNEGAGYGTSKCKWLMNATLYFDTALPEAHLGRNPFYRRLGDWFCRVIPVGMNHHAWGNQANASRGNHLAHMRKFAYLTGEGRFLLNWQEYGGKDFSTFRPWIEYVLPAYYNQPTPEPERDAVALFPIDGWAMAASGPPSLRSTYDDGTGVIFQCRPRGGFSHSFNSDGSFQLHAYGQMLNHGGGSSANQDAFAYHTMSHNTLLIDGLGQAQTSTGQTSPTYGRIVGFQRGDQYTYFAGDVTHCYPTEPGNYARWGLPLDKVYQQRALPYLSRFVRHILYLRNRYFVIYDDVAATQPATFTWLYHLLPDDPIDFDPQSFRLDYSVGKVRVRLQQLSHPSELVLEDRRGLDGFTNPITGEDYREWRKDNILCGHNLWISNSRPAKDWSFLTVVYPQEPGGAFPEIQRLDDATVRVGADVICFDPRSAFADQSTFLVDVAAMRAAAP